MVGVTVGVIVGVWEGVLQEIISNVVQPLESVNLTITSFTPSNDKGNGNWYVGGIEIEDATGTHSDNVISHTSMS